MGIQSPPALRALAVGLLVLGALCIGFHAGRLQARPCECPLQSCPAQRSCPVCPRPTPSAQGGGGENPLWEWFRSGHSPNMVTKWSTYLDPYHRHLSRYRGNELKMLVVGVSSGGDINMWQDYFGDGLRYWGLDHNKKCLKYRDLKSVQDIIIGSQEEAGMWSALIPTLPDFDIIIDDGGHTMNQQKATWRALFLAKLKPGGIWITEDTHSSYWTPYGGGYGRKDTFLETNVKPLVDQLHYQFLMGETPTPEQVAAGPPRWAEQPWITGVHLYNSIVVVEKNEAAPALRKNKGPDTLNAYDPMEKGFYIQNGELHKYPT